MVTIFTRPYASRTAAQADLLNQVDDHRAQGWTLAGGPHFHTEGGKTVLTQRFIKED